MAGKSGEIEQGSKGAAGAEVVTWPVDNSQEDSELEADLSSGSEKPSKGWFGRPRTKEQKLLTKLDFFIL